MGILGALFGPTPAQEVMASLEGFTFKPGLSETKFRDLLTKHLAANLSVAPKREAGLHGQGTRFDMFFEHRDEQFIVTIKQALSEQKVKTLLGEAVIIASTLIYSSYARKSNLVFVIMDDHRWKPEARDGDMDTLLRGLVVVMELLSGFKKIELKLQLAWCAPTGGQAIPLST